jgi:hypothetical protein
MGTVSAVNFAQRPKYVLVAACEWRPGVEIADLVHIKGCVYY